MVLVDTTVWIAHLRAPDPDLSWLLEEDLVLVHPWVRGELSLGCIRDRDNFLELLDCLPQVDVAGITAMQTCIAQSHLWGSGVGWVDVQLLAACATHPCRLFTKDQRLATAAATLGLAWRRQG